MTWPGILWQCLWPPLAHCRSPSHLHSESPPCVVLSLGLQRVCLRGGGFLTHINEFDASGNPWSGHMWRPCGPQRSTRWCVSTFNSCRFNNNNNNNNNNVTSHCNRGRRVIAVFVLVANKDELSDDMTTAITMTPTTRHQRRHRSRHDDSP